MKQPLPENTPEAPFFLPAARHIAVYEPKLILQATDKCAEQLSLDKESENSLHKKLKQVLTSEQYGILLMYLNGYSYSEIASKHAITNKKVDNNIQAIKRKLKILFKGE